MNKTNSILVGILITIIGFFVFSQANINPLPANDQVNKNTSVTPSIVEDEKMVDIEAGSFYFKPNSLTLKKGEPVTLRLKSVDMMHDFVIDELGVRVPVTKSGNESVVTFTPSKSGTFEYYCSVSSHRQKGQVGTLVVTE